jgi:hypothetical protein
MRKFLSNAAKVVGIIAILLIAAGIVALRMSDGPTGPIPGGELSAGPLVSEPDVDWSLATGGEIELQLVEPLLIELQLVEPVGSRVTGVMLYEGQLFVPCDLGFSWGRFSGPQRWVLHLIYFLKGWHEDVLRDGRVVLRIAGKRYERQAVRVTDPELLATLRLEFEKLVEQWVSPAPLGKAPTDGPKDIWFFRMDPRPVM